VSVAGIDACGGDMAAGSASSRAAVADSLRRNARFSSGI
jgi:hypothetical protein